MNNINPRKYSSFDSKKQTNQSIQAKEGKKIEKPTSYTRSPSPPKLEIKQQQEFISLIKKSNLNFKLDKKNISDSEDTSSITHPDLINTKGPIEFNGNINPKTGEINGPKRDPLKWPNEWAYGGRATDF